MLSHSPGGLGAFEATIVAGLGRHRRSDVSGSTFYYIVSSTQSSLFIVADFWAWKPMTATARDGVEKLTAWCANDSGAAFPAAGRPLQQEFVSAWPEYFFWLSGSLPDESSLWVCCAKTSAPVFYRSKSPLGAVASPGLFLIVVAGACIESFTAPG